MHRDQHPFDCQLETDVAALAALAAAEERQEIFQDSFPIGECRWPALQIMELEWHRLDAESRAYDDAAMCRSARKERDALLDQYGTRYEVRFVHADIEAVHGKGANVFRQLVGRGLSSHEREGDDG